eukprot:GHVP01059115.1.p2 GENE.GHVP01059115.1~~GHVP01059115.1.p2  ORF type:complete len:112 (-),score=28.55 GHVP01059115.1:202-537(-)
MSSAEVINGPKYSNSVLNDKNIEKTEDRISSVIGSNKEKLEKRDEKLGVLEESLEEASLDANSLVGSARSRRRELENENSTLLYVFGATFLILGIGLISLVVVDFIWTIFP